MTNENAGSGGNILKRVLIYIIGLFLIAFGAVISINSNLGITPVTSLPYIISLITGTAMSIWIIVISGAFILLQAVILGKKFKLVNLAQFVFSFIFGYFVDFSKWILDEFTLPTYFGRLLMLAISIAAIALGVLFYIEAKLVSMPPDGLGMAITEKTGAPFHNIKVMVDSVTVGITIVLSLLFLHKLVGVREGTVITALLVGKVVGLFEKPFSPMIRRLIANNHSFKS